MSFTKVPPGAAKSIDEMPLTEPELAALKGVLGGADIYSDQLAKLLRGLEALGLVTVTKPMMPEQRGPAGDGVWFGCIATAKGKAALKAARPKPAPKRRKR